MNASRDEELVRGTRALFARASRKSERVILPINTCASRMDQSAPAFFCVHPISGAAGSEYSALARQLDPAVRFYEIQAPPKKIQQSDFGTSVTSIADYYIEALNEFQQTGPFLLGGYSAGAIIALEIAQRLRARGREVALLVIVDEGPPNIDASLQPWSPRYLAALTRNLPGWFAHAELFRKGFLRSLGRRVSTKAITIGKAALGVRPDKSFGGGYALDRILDLSRYPPAQKSFIYRLYAAVVGYVPEQYPGPVVVYEANVKPLYYLPQVGLRWRKIAASAEIVGITGMHTNMMREPHVEELALDLRKRIAEKLQ